MSAHFQSPQILVGHSLGGAAVLAAAVMAAAARLPQVKGVATIGAPAGPAHVAHLNRVELASSIRDLKNPLLVLHSAIDNTVGVANAATLFKAAGHPKSFVSLDTADHMLSNPADARYAGTFLLIRHEHAQVALAAGLHRREVAVGDLDIAATSGCFADAFDGCWCPACQVSGRFS